MCYAFLGISTGVLTVLEQECDPKGYLSRPVSLWKRASNLCILLGVTVKVVRLGYVVATRWISLYRAPLASRPIFVGGPQKMTDGQSVQLRKSWGFRTRRITLEWATTRRLVLFPTSASNPDVGASFMRITHSARSISAPALVSSTWLELVTRAHWPQCRVRL